MLHACFDNLPKTKKVYQGDFIGFGGDYIYRPNTITYRFDKIIKQNIIIAPHTLYHVKQDLRDAVAVPISSIPRVDNKTKSSLSNHLQRYTMIMSQSDQNVILRDR